MIKGQTQTTRKYAYRPLKAFGGSVLKCAGFQDSEEGFEFYDAYYRAGKQGDDHMYGDIYETGVIWMDEYKGDRIYANTLEEFKG